eukprot:CAMPEP_0118899356 /NCGR_PEP_ID=MMETSP1166-20130328/5946_1 /TAXON_ID=1104430 /ORGANISM="Chrysoreinhardia sp, Strain CCMP3193" /LENGTH=824 /DNA_ID=CAMNT_0006838483 /DNA_START=1 /DNA_END=2475 /DNA_ORIENTATION=-
MVVEKKNFAKATYEGEWKGKPHGVGELRYKSGAVYSGSFVEGLKHGDGTFDATDGSRFEGQWREDKVLKGTMRYADGRVYDGEWQNGKRHGVGSCTYPNASRYNGEWRCDVRRGDGALEHDDGSSYRGAWKDNQPHGHGVYTFASGDTFRGEWRQGKKIRGDYEGTAAILTATTTVTTPPAATTTVTPPPPPAVTPPPEPAVPRPEAGRRRRRSAVVGGGSEAVDGTYAAQAKVGIYGETVYYNKVKRTWLYEIEAKRYAIGRKKAGTACLSFNTHDALTAGGTWMVYAEEQWVPSAGLRVRLVDGDLGGFSEEEDPSGGGAPGGFRGTREQEESVAKAVAVSSRFANLDGGYLRTAKTANGKFVYANAEDRKELWFGPKGRWLISDEAGVRENGSYSSYATADPGDAASPEDACWGSALTVRACPSPEERALAEEQLLRRPGGVFVAEEDSLSLYSDPDFPASDESLGPQTIQKSKSGVVWLRGPALLGGSQGEPVKLFNGIEPNDVAQGALGDCWLLSAISAVTEFPLFVEDNLFVTKELNPAGEYDLRLYDARARDFKIVTVDDAVPCAKGSWWQPPRPLFAQPADNELYILLIEKAFAKLCGSYDMLSGGYPLLAWCAMTGCEDLQSWGKSDDEGTQRTRWTRADVAVDKVREKPFDFQHMYTFKVDDNQDDAHPRGPFDAAHPRGPFDAAEMFDFLRHCDDKNYIMAASISGATLEKARTDGLVERHAYSLIAVKEVASRNVKLVQLRNPWGNDREWNGPWSDGAPEWDTYPDVNAALDYEPRDDGLFWMSWDDFHSTFDGVQVAAIEMPTRRATHRQA